MVVDRKLPAQAAQFIGRQIGVEVQLLGQELVEVAGSLVPGCGSLIPVELGKPPDRHVGGGAQQLLERALNLGIDGVGPVVPPFLGMLRLGGLGTKGQLGMRVNSASSFDWLFVMLAGCLVLADLQGDHASLGWRD
jgi:hypothetical protein